MFKSHCDGQDPACDVCMGLSLERSGAGWAGGHCLEPAVPGGTPTSCHGGVLSMWLRPPSLNSRQQGPPLPPGV